MLNFKQKNIEKKIKKQIASYGNKKVVVKPIQQVAVLNNPASNLTFDNLKYVQKQLGLSSNNFDIFTFKEKKDNYNELRGIIATKDIFSGFGKIKSPEIQQFLNKKYDLLLDFTGMSNPYEKYLSLHIQANFRVGYYQPQELYDLMIDVKQGDIKTFINETVKYLNIIGLIKQSR